MVFSLWQIIMTIFGGALFLVFFILDYKKAKARKLAKKQEKLKQKMTE